MEIKSEKQLDGIRKPILTTPNAKRERKEEGDWIEVQGATNSNTTKTTEHKADCPRHWRSEGWPQRR